MRVPVVGGMTRLDGDRARRAPPHARGGVNSRGVGCNVGPVGASGPTHVRPSPIHLLQGNPFREYRSSPCAQQDSCPREPHRCLADGHGRPAPPSRRTAPTATPGQTQCAGATATGAFATAVGNLATATGDNSSAFGNAANAAGAYSSAVGNLAQAAWTAARPSAIATPTAPRGLGSTAVATARLRRERLAPSPPLHGAATPARPSATAPRPADIRTAIGNLAQATFTNTTALGNNAKALAAGATAVGNLANATGTNSSAFGLNANASANNPPRSAVTRQATVSGATGRRQRRQGPPDQCLGVRHQRVRQRRQRHRHRSRPPTPPLPSATALGDRAKRVRHRGHRDRQVGPSATGIYSASLGAMANASGMYSMALGVVPGRRASSASPSARKPKRRASSPRRWVTIPTPRRTRASRSVRSSGPRRSCHRDRRRLVCLRQLHDRDRRRRVRREPGCDGHRLVFSRGLGERQHRHWRLLVRGIGEHHRDRLLEHGVRGLRHWPSARSPTPTASPAPRSAPTPMRSASSATPSVRMPGRPATTPAPPAPTARRWAR